MGYVKLPLSVYTLGMPSRSRFWISRGVRVVSSAEGRLGHPDIRVSPELDREHCPPESHFPNAPALGFSVWSFRVRDRLGRELLSISFEVNGFD